MQLGIMVVFTTSFKVCIAKRPSFFRRKRSHHDQGDLQSEVFPFANRPEMALSWFMRNPDYELIRTRTTLINRLKNWQDQASWQAFFDIYWKLIYNFAVKSGLTATEAKDVVQETMISVAKHMPGFKYDRKIGSFKTWLLSMARWRITDQYRRRSPVWNSKSNSDNDSNSTPDAELAKIADRSNQDMDALWDAEWKRTLLEAAMGKVKRSLDPKHYQVFDFYVNKEWAPARIAGTFGITVGQVYLTKHRVGEAIKEELKRLKETVT